VSGHKGELYVEQNRDTRVSGGLDSTLGGRGGLKSTMHDA